VYQILFMPETKDKTLEDIDLLFRQPTRELVRENWNNSMQTASDLMHFRFRRVQGGIRLRRFIYMMKFYITQVTEDMRGRRPVFGFSKLGD
jgi:hypothetical protein